MNIKQCPMPIGSPLCHTNDTATHEHLPSLLIVGSTGRMGAFFYKKFSELLQKTNPSVHTQSCVRGIDIPFTTEKLAEACQDIDLVLLCVPAAHIQDVVLRLKPHLPKDAIMADITSVKVHPLEEMEKHWSGPVIGTHPLFGPGSHKGTAMPVAIMAGKNSQDVHVLQVESLFQAIGCSTFRCTAAQHDKAMAAIQNLNFITSLAYFAALAPLAEDEDILPFLTPSFRRRQDATRRMLTEDAALFTGLFEANPYSLELVRTYRSFLNIAAGGDIDLLVQRAQWWWE